MNAHVMMKMSKYELYKIIVTHPGKTYSYYKVMDSNENTDTLHDELVDIHANDDLVIDIAFARVSFEGFDITITKSN